MTKTKNARLTKEEIFVKMKEILTCSLAVDEEEVTPGATIHQSLGAESIDRLEITFQMEKMFGLKTSEDCNPLKAMDRFDSTEWVMNGWLTRAGIRELRRRMPYLEELWRVGKNPRAETFHNHLTVQMLVDYIFWKQDNP